MTKHILFRFHTKFDVCQQHVEILRNLNPGCVLHGMYGGAGGIDAVPVELARAFDTLFPLPFEDAYNNWKNGDICLRWWFKETGKSFSFRHLYIVEWDMLYLRNLDVVFGALETGANYMTISATYDELLKDKWPWIQGSWKWQVDALLQQLEERGTPVDITKLSFGIMGGSILSREFLEAFAQVPISGYSNDEVRIALYSQAFGVPLRDNRLASDKTLLLQMPEEEGGPAFSVQAIQDFMKNGGKAVHPVRKVLPGLCSGIVNIS